MSKALPDLEVICSLERECDVPGVLSMSDLLRRGEDWLSANPHGVDELAARVGPDDLLTIVYTSGTTADPKGVMLTHGNVLSNVAHRPTWCSTSARRSLPVGAARLAHVRAHDGLPRAACGAELIYTDRRKVKEDLARVRRRSSPRCRAIWETIHDGLDEQVREAAAAQAALMRFVLDTCRRVGPGQRTLRDRVVHAILERTLLKKFRAVTGGQLRVAVSGGGALPAHVDECLLGLGMPILNGYGLTETSPVVSVRLPARQPLGHHRPAAARDRGRDPGRAGRALPQGEIGLIWIRGPGVMQGYYRNPERTREVLRDGWFNSGDLGTIEPDGHIRITGRAKDTIVLAGGENVEPTRIESGDQGLAVHRPGRGRRPGPQVAWALCWS